MSFLIHLSVNIAKSVLNKVLNVESKQVRSNQFKFCQNHSN